MINYLVSESNMVDDHRKDTDLDWKNDLNSRNKNKAKNYLVLFDLISSRIRSSISNAAAFLFSYSLSPSARNKLALVSISIWFHTFSSIFTVFYFSARCRWWEFSYSKSVKVDYPKSF